MSNIEKTLSDYIDRLNAEEKPEEHGKENVSPELEELISTVRMVKSLKEPALPQSDYPISLAKEMHKRTRKKGSTKSRRSWFLGIASTAAVAAVILLLNITLSLGRNNLVYAMEQAFKDVKAYHGYMLVIETNEEGQKIVQAKREIYADQKGNYYIKELEGSSKDMITANNGERKWQERPDLKQTHIFAAFPDPYRFTFELGKEIEDAKNAIKTETLGEEQVSGRETLVLKVSPKGGDSYKLWIDKNTKLPLKKQSSMHNALQYTVTYTDIEFMDAIPAELMDYRLASGYKEININSEQFVSSLEEAQEAAGFYVKLPESLPSGYVLSGIAVEQDNEVLKLYYTDRNNKKVVVMQGRAAEQLKPNPTAVLGKINENIAEVQSPMQGSQGILAGSGAYAGVTNISSIRWQEEGYEFAVVGDAVMEELRLFVKEIAKGELQIVTGAGQTAAEPQVPVNVDMTIEENEQKSVDAGHTPWKLDPIFVAHVFVNLQIAPAGVQGEYPVQYEAFKVEQNTGSEAVLTLKSDKTPISKVYLKKLIRQDNTGIWTVVGYDTTK